MGDSENIMQGGVGYELNETGCASDDKILLIWGIMCERWWHLNDGWASVSGILRIESIVRL